MADLPPPPSDASSSGSSSRLRPPPLNFSRPRPTSVASKQRLYHDRSDTPIGTPVSTPRSAGAFYESSSDTPAKSQSSLDSRQSDSTRSMSSAASEFAWDRRAGELRSRRQPDGSDHPHPRRPSQPVPSAAVPAAARRPATASGALGSSSQRLFLADSARPSKAVGIATSSVVDELDEQSEPSPVSLPPRGWKASASQYTSSTDGDGSDWSEAKWPQTKSPEPQPDMSGLSTSEIEKLRKKGINPALYAEMKSARRGKGKWLGPLVGNTFIG